jgi:tRNA dimethylallyltransferase
MQKKVIIILGQTATGKSDLAVYLAKNLKNKGLNQPKELVTRTLQSKVLGEIISADSRQVYQGLDIGTGKITTKEMQNIPHHLLDVISPKKRFTVVDYQKLANKKIKEIIARNRIPIICGGTGFYIDAITKGLIFPNVKANKKLRKQLNKKSPEQLFKILKKLDKKRALAIKNKNEINNKVRLIRAIEIAQNLGKVPALVKTKSPYSFIKIGLYLPSEILKKKVKKRVHKMFRAGLLKEIKKLKKAGLSDARLKEFGFEYYQPTEEKVISETLKYAKRQMTYFQRDPEIIWLEANKNLNKKTKDLIAVFLKK